MRGNDAMHVPFVDLKTQYQSIKAEMDRAIGEILDSASFIMGKSVKEFESGFGRLHDATYCIGTSSGTDALHLALWGLGISRGEEVLLPVNTFFATAEAIVLSGAVPIFIDCDPISYNIDVEKLKEFVGENCRADDSGFLINSLTDSRVSCIIPVHLYGQPADLDPVLGIAGKYHLKVVEDACQAHLAEYRSRKVGSIGHAGAFSFYPGKNLGAYGEGGAVTTNDPDLFNKMWLIHDHGSREKYNHEVIGHNYRLEGIQAAVLNVKMRHIAKWTEMRRANAEVYRGLLQGIDEVAAPAEAAHARHVYHLYVIRAKDRDELKKFLHEKGVETGLHYPIPLHLQKAFRDRGYGEGSFPVAERYAKEILSLPMYPELTGEQIVYVVEKIKEFYAR
jgi:dTDP-4-amino-4,6-dideoxygalactose transaminase